MRLVWGLLVLVCLGGAVSAAEESAAPYPRISREAYEARLPFFDYNRELPLEARVVQAWDREETLRQKIVFRGAQGFLVPGFLETPKQATPPYPLVLLLHGWSGAKTHWYEDGNIISGGELRSALLQAGFAVCALDAATHGERSNEIDYQHVNPHEDPEAPPRANYFTFAEIAVQTVKDYRRLLDYLAQRDEIDLDRVGLAGYSMGGMNAFHLLAVEPRIRAAVACVPPFVGGYGPAAPVDYTWDLPEKRLLLLMGRQDDMYDAGKVAASYEAYIQGPATEIRWYDQGHKLSPVYVPDAVTWLQMHLGQ